MTQKILRAKKYAFNFLITKNLDFLFESQDIAFYIIDSLIKLY